MLCQWICFKSETLLVNVSLYLYHGNSIVSLFNALSFDCFGIFCYIVSKFPSDLRLTHDIDMYLLFKTLTLRCFSFSFIVVGLDDVNQHLLFFIYVLSGFNLALLTYRQLTHLYMHTYKGIPSNCLSSILFKSSVIYYVTRMKQ